MRSYRVISREDSGHPEGAVKRNISITLHNRCTTKCQETIFLDLLDSVVPVLSIYKRNVDVSPELFWLRLTGGEDLR